MRVTRHDGEFAMRAEVYPFEDDKRHKIEVERRRSLRDLNRWEEEAGIVWGSLGERSSDAAKQYANAILEACRIAEEMNAVADSELTTPGGYMVVYERGDRRKWERIENGADVPIWDGWTVAKAQRWVTPQRPSSRLSKVLRRRRNEH